MDPVAEQFLAQLDAATDELPRSVEAGLAMCGNDVVPGLVERLTDPERPVPTRAFAAQVLAEMKVPEGWDAMADVVAGGSVVMLPPLGRLLAGGGTAAAEASLSRAENSDLIPEVRLVLAGLAVRAGGVAWATPRASVVACDTYAAAPGPALALMRMTPSAEYGPVLRERPELLRADPTAALQVLLAHEPDSELRRMAEAVASGLDGVVDDALSDVARALVPEETAASSEVRDEP